MRAFLPQHSRQPLGGCTTCNLSARVSAGWGAVKVVWCKTVRSTDAVDPVTGRSPILNAATGIGNAAFALEPRGNGPNVPPGASAASIPHASVIPPLQLVAGAAEPRDRRLLEPREQESATRVTP